MKIRTQFIFSLAVFGAILITLAVSLAITSIYIQRYNRQEEITGNIERSARELSYIANSYLLYGERQQRTRWESAYSSLSNDLSRLDRIGPEEQAVVDNIRANLARLKAIFTEVIATIERASQTRGSSFDQAFIQVSWSRMEVQSQAIVFDSSRLSNLLDDRFDQARQRSSSLLSALLATFGIYLFLSYLLVYRRILKSISELKAGAGVIGSGNLDYVVSEKQKDEIGDLARAFNRMAASLKKVTASKTDLEREIAARRKMEETLKDSEQRYRSLAENVPSVLMRYNRDLRIEYISTSTEQYTGIPAAGFIGKTNREVGMPEHLCVLWEDALQEVFRTGSQKDLEFDFKSIAAPKTFYLKLAPEYDHLGMINHVLGISTDITELKKVERMKDEFVGMVSHELKTPLTVLIGALSLATDKGVSEEESRDLIQDAMSQSYALAAIVENLLELSRYQANRLALKTELADVGQIVQAVASKLQARSAIHQLVTDIPPGLPHAIIDRIRVERIINNLVDNAIKYSPKGGEVRIFASRQDDRLLVGVSDQGIGISQKDQARLFQSFERLGAYETHTIAGVGLGLKVCRILVEAHGGRIWIDSQPGKGSTFFFTLYPADGSTL